jgi:hypothetical protein
MFGATLQTAQLLATAEEYLVDSNVFVRCCLLSGAWPGKSNAHKEPVAVDEGCDALPDRTRLTNQFPALRPFYLQFSCRDWFW